MTDLRVLPDGSLTENVAERIIVWGWDAIASGAPELRYDGPLGGKIPDWDAASPEPFVSGGDSALIDWWMTTFRIAPDGTTSGIIVDRLVVWGW